MATVMCLTLLCRRYLRIWHRLVWLIKKTADVEYLQMENLPQKFIMQRCNPSMHIVLPFAACYLKTKCNVIPAALPSCCIFSSSILLCSGLQTHHKHFIPTWDDCSSIHFSGLTRRPVKWAPLSPYRPWRPVVVSESLWSVLQSCTAAEHCALPDMM